MEMATGIVKLFDRDRGFVPDDGSADVFVHIKQVVSSSILTEGQRVQFQVGMDERKGKPEAQGVRVL
jgi:cold shock CspA family protein